MYIEMKTYHDHDHEVCWSLRMDQGREKRHDVRRSKIVGSHVSNLMMRPSDVSSDSSQRGDGAMYHVYRASKIVVVIVIVVAMEIAVALSFVMRTA